jgi:hypothetical protein
LVAGFALRAGLALAAAVGAERTTGRFALGAGLPEAAFERALARRFGAETRVAFEDFGIGLL